MAVNFTVQLVDKASSPAALVTRNLTSLADRMRALEGNAKSLEKQMSKASALGDHAKVAKLAQQHTKLVGALDKSALSQGQFAKQLDTAIMGLHPATIAIAAYIGVLGGLAGILYEGAKLSLAASAFKRETIAAFTFLTGSARVGRETLEIIRSIEGSVPELEATLAERAKGLLTAGLDPSRLKSQLLTLSNVAAVAGEEGMAKLQSLQEKVLTTGQFKFAGKALKGTGVTEAELAAQLGLPGPRALDAALKAGTISVNRGLDAIATVINRKFGGAATEKVKTLTGLSNKLHDNIFKIFEDVKTGPFIDGLLGIVNLLDQSSNSGKLFKWVVESVFNKGFAESGGILLGVKHGIQHVAIAGLELYIKMKPALASFSKLWEQAKKSENLKLALKGIGGVILVLAAGVALAAGAMIALTAGTVAAVAAVALGIGFIIAKVVKTVALLPKILVELKDTVKAKAAAFVDGIIEGIQGGVGRLKGAIKSLANVLPKTLADKLEIKSPSKLAERQGAQYPAGLAQGMDKGRARVATSAAMVASTAASGAPAAGAGVRGGKSLVVHIDKVIVELKGEVGDITTLTATGLARVLEMLALKEGLGNPG